MVLPLDRVSERLAAPFLLERDHRRLLVLLVDGMAWAQAAELLLDLEEHHVGPVAWDWSRKGRVGEGTAAVHNVVLAGLPSITEVSRSAFFEGALMTPGKDYGGVRDDERFRRNKALLQFFGANESPTLMLRAEVSADVGHASEAAKRAVADRDTRVVGVVLNAIDASLKGDPQTHIRWTANTIRPLLPLLDAAREAGRTVLLVADHGHVPSDCFGSGTAMKDGGARWRPWAGADDPVAEWELVFDGEGVWKPRGAEGVALITDDRHRYGSAAHAGEHGGATLAEVVVPCLFLGFDQPASALDQDRDLSVRDFHRPSFWRLEVRENVEYAPTRAKPAQLGLLGGVPLTGAPAPPSTPNAPVTPLRAADAKPPLGPLAQALRDSPLLRAAATLLAPADRVVRAVAFLEARGGLASEQAFAAEMEEPVRRVGQLVSVLSEPLNVDSFPVLAHDRPSRQVRLDCELLVQQFALRKEPPR